MDWFDIAGWFGALFTAGAYSVRNMRLFRTIALAANFSFITYGIAAGVTPVLALHLFLLSMNLYRLREIFAATQRLRQSRRQKNPVDALKPFLKPGEFARDAVLFRRGDAPDRVYYLEAGEIELPELERTISAGTIFGELAFFSNEKARTTSAICRTPCRILSIGEDEFMNLFHQHPEFSFYLVRLMAQRVAEGSRDHPELYGGFA